MKRLIQLAVLAPIAALATGCATPYMIDRGRDARDIITATVGVGLGAKIRLGPVHAGVLINHDVIGLRDSALNRYGLSLNSVHGLALEWETAILPLPGPYQEWVFACDAFAVPQPFNGRHLKADYIALSHFPFITTSGMRRQSYTQIEVVVGLGPSCRLGFNP